MRSYKSVYASFRKHLLDMVRNAADIFISTWSRTCLTSPATGAVTFADLERLYAPCGAEIEEFPLDGRECFRGVRMPAELASMMRTDDATIPAIYKLLAGMQLKRMAEVKREQLYDRVLFLRPDVELLSPLPLEIFKVPPHFVANDGESQSTILNVQVAAEEVTATSRERIYQIAAGSSLAMDYYASVWEKLHDYWRDPWNCLGLHRRKRSRGGGGVSNSRIFNLSCVLIGKALISEHISLASNRVRIKPFSTSFTIHHCDGDASLKEVENFDDARAEPKAKHQSKLFVYRQTRHSTKPMYPIVPLDPFGDRANNSEEVALGWWKAAADLGDAEAQYTMGILHENGRGVEKSYEKADQLFEKSARKGYADAQYHLATLYRKGQVDANQNYEKAMEWYEKAAEQGHAEAQYNLGVMSEHGRGTQNSNEKALMWYGKAAKQGHTHAQYNLGVMYNHGRGVEENSKEAFKWYSVVAKQGVAAAQFNVGLMYYKGHGVEQNYTRAIEWYEKSAKQGRLSSQMNLGIIYHEGAGVSQNLTNALYWLRMAAAQGNKTAKEKVDIVLAEYKKSRLRGQNGPY